MSDLSRQPTSSDLRVALSALYPDASHLELAIQQLATSAPPEIPQIDGVDTTCSGRVGVVFQKLYSAKASPQR